MPSYRDALDLVTWLFKHNDVIVPLITAVLALAAWVAKRAEGRRKARLRPAPQFPSEPAPVVVDAPLASVRRRLVSALNQPPAPLPPPPPQPLPPASRGRVDEELPALGVASFARRLGNPELLRDAVVATEIFGVPPGLR